MSEETPGLLAFLNSEIQERSHEIERTGSSPWLLIVSLATLVWLLINTTYDFASNSVSRIIIGLITYMGLRNLQQITKNIINKPTAAKPGHFLYYRQLFRNYSQIHFFELIRSALVVFGLIQIPLPVPLYLKWSILIFTTIGAIGTLLVFTVGEKISIPIFSKPRFEPIVKASLGILLLYFVFIFIKLLLFPILRTGIYTLDEIKLIIVLCAILYISEELLWAHRKDPTVETLRSIREDLILGIDSVESIKYRIETELLGYKLSELLRIEIIDIEEKFEELSKTYNHTHGLHSNAMQIVEILNNNFRQGLPNEPKEFFNYFHLGLQVKFLLDKYEQLISQLIECTNSLDRKIQTYVYQDSTLTQDGLRILHQIRERTERYQESVQTLIQESNSKRITDPDYSKYLPLQ